MTAAAVIEQSAAHWLMRRGEPGWSEEDQRDLTIWLDQSPAHKAAFWRLELGWEMADRITALGLPAQDARPQHWERSHRYMALAASFLFFCVSGSSVLQWGNPATTPHEAQYATRTGQRRNIVLGDGTRVTLNTASRIRVLISGQERRVWLDQGEAYFDVVHDERRPFAVLTGDYRVTDVGTQFSVRRYRDATRVAVAGGQVRIDGIDAGPGDGGALASAGDIAVAEGQSILLSRQSTEKVEDALSWRRGTLTFDQVTLAEAAAELNRYNRQQIVFADNKAAQILVGGSFQADNAPAFARLLHDAFGLRVQDEGETLKISS